MKGEITPKPSVQILSTTSEDAGAIQLHQKMVRFHVGGYFMYNVLIGYMLVYTAESGFLTAMLFMVAMALHFFVMTHGLHASYGQHYRRHLQWLLVMGIAMGWLAGVTLDVPKNIKIILFSFLAGAIIVNTIREEMPSGSENRFWPFTVGTLGYTVLLLTVHVSRHP